MKTRGVLPPGSVIGIIGGGQLGRMSAVAAARLGYHVHVLTDILPAPAAELAACVTCGAYDDMDLLEKFARSCNVISFEFENISAESLQKLEGLCPVHPSVMILETSQNRITEKTMLARHDLPVAPWCAVYHAGDLSQIEALGFPLILKTARFGYDGKGQYRLPDQEAFAALSPESLSYPLVAERQIDFAREISVMVMRNEAGDCACFDVAENYHHAGILRVSAVPASITPDLAASACAMAQKLAHGLKLVGIMGVEFFHDAGGSLIINEMAPRPHNSGHWTMDACLADQFEMYIRAITGLPLFTPRRHSDVFMHNLTGPEDMAFLPDILKEEGARIHLYGKSESRPGRKMGHVNRLFPYGALPGSLALEVLLPPLADTTGY